MVSRADIVELAMSFNGNGDGEGYPGYSNPFSKNLGRPNEYWCGDFVTDIYKRCGVALPSMQPGCKTGYAYCPDGLNYARDKKAVVNSWEAKPGDWIFFNTGSGAQPGHTGLVTAYHGSTLYSIAGDSGPSNIDSYRKQGGVHRNAWSAPVGKGYPGIMAVVDADKIVDFTKVKTHKPGVAPSESPRMLMLKTPMMKGNDVTKVQESLTKHGDAVKVDGTYGPATRNAVLRFQEAHKINIDGIVGPATHKALGL